MPAVKLTDVNPAPCARPTHGARGRLGPVFGWSPVRPDLPSTTRDGMLTMLSATRFTQTAAELRHSFGVGSIQGAAAGRVPSSSQPLLQGHRDTGTKPHPVLPV